MINYTLFNDRASKRVFGLELLNVVNSGLNFVKSGLSISNIGGLSYSVSSGEFYLGGESYSFGGDSIVLTGAGSGGYKLVALLVDSSGVLSKSDGVVSSSVSGVKCPSVNPLTHFCVGIILLNEDVGTIFNTSIVNDYFSDVYLDDSIDDVVDKNAEDIFDLQTVFKNNTSFIPVDNPFTFRDWFVSTGGKNSSINTGNTTADFDTDKYKLTFDSTTTYGDVASGREYSHDYERVQYSDVSPAQYVNDLRIIARAAVSKVLYNMCQSNFQIRLVYEDDSYWDSGFFFTYCLYSDVDDTAVEHYSHNLLELVHYLSKKVKRVEIWSNTVITGNGANYIGVEYNLTPINNIIETQALSFDGVKTHTKLVSNINTSETISCPSGTNGNANYGFTGGSMSQSYFKYDLYDSLGNVQENLSLDTKNAISGLVGNPVKMVIKIVPPTVTSWWDTHFFYSYYEDIPLLRQISGKPYINDFCLITYEE